MKLLRTLEFESVQFFFTKVTTAKLSVTECDHEKKIVNIGTEICLVHVRGHGLFFLHECDHRQFLLQNVAKEYFYKCGHYSFRHECDY